jgi:RHS repeat-associated protein
MRTHKDVTVGGVVTTTTYTYNGKLLTHYTRGTCSQHFYYDVQGRPAMVKYTSGGTTAYYTYVHNLQGDVVGLLDNANTLVVKYSYDAWGVPFDPTGTMAATLGVENPFRYRGYVYDGETGYYYLRSRYYDPGLRRFVNADDFYQSVSGLIGLNIFAYCNNQPILRADHDGHASKVVIGAGINTVHDYSYKEIAEAEAQLKRLRWGIGDWGRRFQRLHEEKWPERFKTAAYFQNYVPSYAKLTNISLGFRHYTTTDKVIDAIVPATFFGFSLAPFGIVGTLLGIAIAGRDALEPAANVGDYLSVTYTYSRTFAIADPYNPEQLTVYTEQWWFRENFNSERGGDFIEEGYINPAVGLWGIYIYEGY